MARVSPIAISLPEFDDADSGATARQIGNITDAAKDVKDPQSRLIIWEASSDLSKPKNDTTPPPPAPWATLAPDSMTSQFTTTLADGRRIVAFSRAPGQDDDDAPFVNILTGAGIPGGAPKAILQASPSAPPPTTTALMKAVLIVGFLLFGAGGLMAAIAGLSVAGAHNMLTAANPIYQTKLVERIAYYCVEDELATLPDDASARAPICEKVFAANNLTKLDDIKKKITAADFDVAAFAASQSLSQNGLGLSDETRACTIDVKKGDQAVAPDCGTLWRSALDTYQTASRRTWFMDRLADVSALLVGPNPTIGSTSIVVPYLVSLFGTAVVLGALGVITRARVAGVWIDQRNRISLGRAQVTLWTVILLSGYLTFVLFNVGYAAVLNSTASWANYKAFPTMDWNYWAALGISTASSVLSALTLATKDKPFDVSGTTSDPAQARGNFFGANTSGLAKNDDPADASITDLVMGEEQANKDIVDIARLQNLLITISLVSAVFWQLIESASNIPMKQTLAGNGALITDLPGLGATFSALLFASQAAYLTAKAHDKPNRDGSGGNDQYR